MFLKDAHRAVVILKVFGNCLMPTLIYTVFQMKGREDCCDVPAMTNAHSPFFIPLDTYKQLHTHIYTHTLAHTHTHIYIHTHIHT